MPWLWFVGPIGVALLYILIATRPDRRRSFELSRWRAGLVRSPPRGKEKPGKKAAAKAPAGPREVATAPGEMARAVEDTGAGSVSAYYELAHKLAYLAIVDSNAACSTDHQVVVAKLAKSAPTFI